MQDITPRIMTIVTPILDGALLQQDDINELQMHQEREMDYL